MSITVSGRMEIKVGYNGSVSTYDLQSIPSINIGTESSISLEVYGTASGFNSLSAYLNTTNVTTRPGGEARPSTDYDSVRTVWGGSVFPRDAVNILSAMEQVGASIGDIYYAMASTGTPETFASIRQKLGLIAPPLRWKMTVNPTATIWIGPLTYPSATDRSADSPSLNGCQIVFPEKSTRVNYQLSIELYGTDGTYYSGGGITVSREATFTPGPTLSGSTVSDTGKIYNPYGYYQFLPAPYQQQDGTLSNGSSRTVPSTASGVAVKWELSTATAGPVTPYSDYRITNITPATGQTVPTPWIASTEWLQLTGLTTTRSTYTAEIRYWDTDPRLTGGSLTSTPASSTSTVTFLFKNADVTTATVTETNTATTTIQTGSGSGTVTETATVVNKGSSLTFNVTTSGYPAGTVLSWTIDGNVKTNDFTDNLLSGTVTVQSNTASVTKTVSSTISSDAYFTFRLKSTTGDVLASSSQIRISSHTITPSTTTVNENGTVVFTVMTANVTDGTTVYWTTQGTVSSADFTDNKLTGSVSITGNTASIVRQLVEDVRKEGSENFKLELRTGSETGPVIAQSEFVTVNDTSAPPPVPGYTGNELYDSNAPNSPTNAQYFDIVNLNNVVTPLNKIQDEVKSMDEKFGTSNSYLSRIADSLDSIATSLKGIESHQKTMKDLAEGKGINTTTPYEWFNMITTYRLLIEEGVILNAAEEVSAAEQQKAFDEVTKYVEIISKLPTALKK